MVTLHEVITFFFFNDTATTEIYTLSLHDALPISEELLRQASRIRRMVLGANHPNTLTSMANLAATYGNQGRWKEAEDLKDRKSTRLNSSHLVISYAVFCLKKNNIRRENSVSG